ncbi:DUF6343 family protein [Streptomyces sp. NBC_01707]|uniref:DUF6343 family protein n=1 Tax=Streptomyces sp. NBC_01707 TaxID=2975914 RepID=UPI00352EFCE0
MKRTGTEPATAQSALGLRLALCVIALPVFVAGAVLFTVWAASGPRSTPDTSLLLVLVVVCAALAVMTAADLLIIVRRRARQRRQAL